MCKDSRCRLPAAVEVEERGTVVRVLFCVETWAKYAPLRQDIYLDNQADEVPLRS